MVDAPEKHLFTCLACQVAFYTADNQREHYRSDWHRYNLKRKMADLEPVTVQEFAEKLQSQQEKAEQDKQEQGLVSECVICSKQYSSENAYNNHLLSKKHKETLASFKGSTEIKQVTRKERNEEAYIERMVQNAMNDLILTETHCIFCTENSSNFEQNLSHMAKIHSFFIPDIEFLVNATGLIKYLQDKVVQEYSCLFCKKSFHSIEAVRKHMTDKGHCKIFYEDDADLEFAEFYNFALVAEDDEWQDVEESENNQVLGENDQLQILGRPLMVDAAQINTDNTEMLLPSGKLVGHRAYNRYWKQQLRLYDRPEVANVTASYRSLGWRCKSPGELEQRKKQAMQTMAKHTNYKTSIGIKANSLQKFFRLQNPM